jgi:hypothetical protein
MFTTKDRIETTLMRGMRRVGLAGAALSFAAVGVLGVAAPANADVPGPAGTKADVAAPTAVTPQGTYYGCTDGYLCVWTGWSRTGREGYFFYDNPDWGTTKFAFVKYNDGSSVNSSYTNGVKLLNNAGGNWCLPPRTYWSKHNPYDRSYGNKWVSHC